MPSRILYVEDNPQNMNLVCRILSHVGGYEVLGAEAWSNWCGYGAARTP